MSLRASETTVDAGGRELRVTSPDPFAMPEIEGRMLSDERDLIRLRDGVRRLAALAEHRAFASVAESVELHDRRGVGPSPSV